MISYTHVRCELSPWTLLKIEGGGLGMVLLVTNFIDKDIDESVDAWQVSQSCRAQLAMMKPGAAERNVLAHKKTSSDSFQPCTLKQPTSSENKPEHPPESSPQFPA